MMRTDLWKLAAMVTLLGGSCVVATAQTYTFTEWATPSANSQPLHIFSGVGSIYYFTESAKDRIASLDTSTNAITEWLLPPGSMPHGVEYSSGSVYMAAFGGSYIATFNPTNSLLTMWEVPTANSGSIHLDLLSTTQLYFSEATGNKIGYLNTATGQFDEWSIPTANCTPRGVAVGQNGQVFFVELATQKVGMLNTSNNTITEWTIPEVKQIEHVKYANGLVYFSDLGSNIVATLNPSTNLVTGWLAPTKAADIPDVAPLSSSIYFTERSGDKIGLLNPSLQKGTSAKLTPVVTSVAPTQTTVTPSTATLSPVTTTVTPTVTNVNGVVNGGFTEWAVPTTGAGPLGIYVNGTTVAFAEYYSNKVAILAPAP